MGANVITCVGDGSCGLRNTALLWLTRAGRAPSVAPRGLLCRAILSYRTVLRICSRHVQHGTPASACVAGALRAAST